MESITSIFNLGDTLNKVRHFFLILGLILAADVGLMMADNKNLYQVLSDPISNRVLVQMAIGILFFWFFNAMFSAVLRNIITLIVVNVSTISKYFYVSKKNWNKTNFSYAEMIFYATKHDNQVLMQRYQEAVKKREDNIRFRNFLFSWLVFFFIDAFMGKDSLVNVYPIWKHNVISMMLTFFFLGLFYYIFLKDDNEDSDSNEAKSYRYGLEVNEIDVLYSEHKAR